MLGLLPATVSEADVAALLKEYGPISSVHLERRRAHGTFAMVHFFHAGLLDRSICMTRTHHAPGKCGSCVMVKMVQSHEYLKIA